MTKPIHWAQAGCSPVSWNQVFARNDQAGGHRRQHRRQHDVFDAQQQHHQAGSDQEKNSEPEPVPTAQQLTKIETKAVPIKVSGATNSPKRCSHGTIAKTIAAMMLIEPTRQDQESVPICTITKVARISTASKAVMESTRFRRAARIGVVLIALAALSPHRRYAIRAFGEPSETRCGPHSSPPRPQRNRWLYACRLPRQRAPRASGCFTVNVMPKVWHRSWPLPPSRSVALFGVLGGRAGWPLHDLPPCCWSEQ